MTSRPPKPADSTPAAGPVERLEEEKVAWMEDEAELREWRSQVEDELGLDEECHTPLDEALERVQALVSAEATLAAVRLVLGIAPEAMVIDAIEDLQRRADAAGAPPTSSSPERSTSPAEVERDTWRAAHEQLARAFGEALRR